MLKIRKFVVAFLSAVVIMLLGAWSLFLCVGGFILFLDVPQPYQAMLWTATGLTLCIAPTMMIYETFSDWK